MFVEAKCPHIEVMKVVPPIAVQLDENKSITQESCVGLLNGASALRSSESYYYSEINKYNSKFTAPLDK